MGIQEKEVIENAFTISSFCGCFEGVDVEVWVTYHGCTKLQRCVTKFTWEKVLKYLSSYEWI